MCLSVSIWGVTYWLWLSSANTSDQALLWIKLLTAGSLLSALFFTHWVIIITRSTKLFWRIVLITTYLVIIGFIAILIVQPDLLIGSLQKKMIFPMWPNAGPLYIYHIIFGYILPLSLVTGLVIKKFIYADDDVKRGQFLSILAGLLLGFIGGGINFFLWFNIPPARFYMGETGVIGLCAALTVVSFLTNSVLVLPIIGFLLVIESGSVILQLFWRKVFHKKLFLAAPIHHHFEAKGWPNYKITMRFWIIGIIMAVIGVAIRLLG